MSRKYQFQKKSDAFGFSKFSRRFTCLLCQPKLHDSSFQSCSITGITPLDASFRVSPKNQIRPRRPMYSNIECEEDSPSSPGVSPSLRKDVHFDFATQAHDHATAPWTSTPNRAGTSTGTGTWSRASGTANPPPISFTPASPLSPATRPNNLDLDNKVKQIVRRKSSRSPSRAKRSKSLTSKFSSKSDGALQTPHSQGNTPYQASASASPMSETVPESSAKARKSRRRSMSKSCVVIHEGPVKIANLDDKDSVPQDLYVILFTDHLIIAKQKSNKALKEKEKVQISDLWVWDEKTLNQLYVGWPIKNHVFVFDESQTKSMWKASLDSCIMKQKEFDEETPDLRRTVLVYFGQKRAQVNIGREETTKDVLHEAADKLNLPLEDLVSHQLYFYLSKPSFNLCLRGQEKVLTIFQHALNQMKNSKVASPAGKNGEVDRATPIFYLGRKDGSTEPPLMIGKNAEASKTNLRKTRARSVDTTTLLARPEILLDHQSGFFGQPIENLTNEDSGGFGLVPPPISALCDRLYECGLEFDGVFRKASLFRDKTDAKERLDRGCGLAYSSMSPILAADLLKFFFRSLPDCVLSSVKYEDWIGVGLLPHLSEKIRILTRMFQELPKVNQETLALVLWLLREVTIRQRREGVAPVPLATCIAPSLLFPSSSLQTSFTAGNQAAINVVALLIEHCESIMAPELYARVLEHFGEDSNQPLSVDEQKSLDFGFSPSTASQDSGLGLTSISSLDNPRLQASTPSQSDLLTPSSELSSVNQGNPEESSAPEENSCSTPSSPMTTPKCSGVSRKISFSSEDTKTFSNSANSAHAKSTSNVIQLVEITHRFKRENQQLRKSIKSSRKYYKPNPNVQLLPSRQKLQSSYSNPDIIASHPDRSQSYATARESLAQPISSKPSHRPLSTTITHFSSNAPAPVKSDQFISKPRISCNL